MLVAAGRSSRCSLLVLLFKGNFTIFLLLWAETWPWQWVSQTLGHKESTPSYNISGRKNPGLWVTLYSNATCHLQSPNPQPPPSTSSNPNMKKKKNPPLCLSTFTNLLGSQEKEMATHSGILAWRIPGMGEPGGLPSMGSHRVGHD